MKFQIGSLNSVNKSKYMINYKILIIKFALC